MAKKNMMEKTFVIQGYNTGDGIGMHVMHAANCIRAYVTWENHIASVWYNKADGDPRSWEDRWIYHVVGKDGMDAYHNWKKQCVAETGGTPPDEWGMAFVDVYCCDDNLRVLNVGQETLVECSCCRRAGWTWDARWLDWFAKEWPDYPIPTPRPLCDNCYTVIDMPGLCEICSK